MSQLTADERLTLLGIARSALTSFLGTGRLPDLDHDQAAFAVERGTFVTLRVRATKELRGCRGESVARRPLVESVAHMAVASATDDPRFTPVTHDEVPALRIEISALTPLVPITVDEIVIGRHGLMIVHAEKSGLLLPQVAAERGWSTEVFLAQLCRKADLPADAWQAAGAVLYGFEAEIWKEE